MATLQGLGAIGRYATTIDRRLAALKKWAALTLWNKVTLKNPVDTGRSRAWWHLAIGLADLTPGPDAPKKGEKVPMPSPPVIGFIPPGATVVVSNNIAYIGRLNAGHSQQAPAGWVDVCVAEVQQGVDSAVAQIRSQDEASL